MRTLFAMMFFSISGCSFGMDSVGAKGIPGIAYYFPKPDICTVMVDYQPSVAIVMQAKGDAKSILLVRSMLKEYAANGVSKCNNAPTVRMLAVLIPGKDSYGRPDFGSRTNLLKMEGGSNKLKALDKDRDNLSLPKIREAALIEVY